MRLLQFTGAFGNAFLAQSDCWSDHWKEMHSEVRPWKTEACFSRSRISTTSFSQPLGACGQQGELHSPAHGDIKEVLGQMSSRAMPDCSFSVGSSGYHEGGECVILTCQLSMGEWMLSEDKPLALTNRRHENTLISKETKIFKGHMKEMWKPFSTSWDSRASLNVKVQKS